MGRKLHLPGPGGDIEIQEPSYDTKVIVQSICQLLQGISNQLDLLIRVEVGVERRVDVRNRINDYEAARAAQLADDAAAEKAYEDRPAT